ncbi:MAG: hemerythrin domain-containing protein [Deltaproteobacteria bacterium]|nr:hemerythrin domain-containing protein [Deltaproteobacteria bacterium]
MQKSLAVIPAKAGIQSFQDVLAPGFRRGDGFVEFCKNLTRKENQLFPILEAYGITAPPEVMWAVHDDIRASIKAAQKSIDQSEAHVAVPAVNEMIPSIRGMIYKEE